MSEFGNLLENAAEKSSAKEMAASMGVDASMISQFTSGEKISCRPDTLMKMVGGVSTDPVVQAKLLESYFRDQCSERFKGWIHVVPDAKPDGRRAEEDEPPYGDESISQHTEALRRLKLPNAVVRALTYIARAIPGRHKFRVVIEDLGTFAREELLPESEKK